MKICNCKTAIVWLLLTCLGPGLMASDRCIAAAEQPASEKAETQAKPIHITSQRLISDQSGNVAEFIGNVQAIQGDTTIQADSLKIFFSKKSDGEGASAAQSLDRLVATGNVEIKFDNRLAVARQAVYITAQRVLTLHGPGARVTSGENTIAGETITFYREDGRFTVEGGTNGRVSAVILPEESGLE
ncbi:lipopolysaccharide transport periplasmic protein LptA [uncultured Desulfosarcina sp.]|uniref:lipopolysaccharide transport periplasmic protein LptA n=1 Tax=uncultured Desulfosarcina sp. TaxID=218289 RepID=UPI0029C740D5|nr:lipopolysaccharide transport periplasmic protein LptA [uncultured Desulfosarcina sp.]